MQENTSIHFMLGQEDSHMSILTVSAVASFAHPFVATTTQIPSLARVVAGNCGRISGDVNPPMNGHAQCGTSGG